jgi:hypothetical protein
VPHGVLPAGADDLVELDVLEGGIADVEGAEEEDQHHGRDESEIQSGDAAPVESDAPGKGSEGSHGGHSNSITYLG